MTPAQTAALLRLIGGHQGSATMQALALVLGGAIPAEAARAAGITPQTLQRSITRAREVAADVQALREVKWPDVL